MDSEIIIARCVSVTDSNVSHDRLDCWADIYCVNGIRDT